RLRRRIDNLLSMARLEAGKAKPRREPTPTADLFRAARENLPLVSMTVHVDADTPDANVDPSLALEILVNLVENAHQVSPAGSPIELVARRHPLDADKIRIEVLDRGPGVPPGVVDGDGNVAAQTTDIAQRGLGLEIARSLAAANGGSIGLAPRSGGGTIARIDLPAAMIPVPERA
ncbi:MAG: sensor histidine kinase, partial [Thermoanaerobaculia bacterium]